MSIITPRIIAVLIAFGSIQSFATSPALAAGAKAILAGGCFWCIEKDFDKVAGVKDVISGYIGGTLKNPTYKTYAGGGHREAVQISYDPKQISYEQLLYIFWRTVDPTDAGGQFCDRGESYSTAIYPLSKTQQKKAKASKAALQKSGVLKRKIVTPIIAAGKFYPSEEFHQNYADKKPLRYKYYRFSCKRDRTVRKLWGKQAYSGVNLGS